MQNLIQLVTGAFVVRCPGHIQRGNDATGFSGRHQSRRDSEAEKSSGSVLLLRLVRSAVVL